MTTDTVNTRISPLRPQWFPLIADQSHTATQNYEHCSICGRSMLRGHRICRLPDGQWIHATCVGRVTP